MGERYKIAMEMQEEERKRKALEEEALQRAIEEDEKKWLAREAAMRNADERRTALPRFKESVRSALLTEALTRICIGSIRQPTDNERAVCEALVGNYVQEKGAEELLSDFRNTSFLENLRTVIDKHVDIITEDADENDPDSMVVTKDNMDDFFEELDDTENMEDVTNTIRLRVSNAEEDFVNKTAMDRENLKSIIQDTSKRVEDAKPGLDNDYSDDSEEALDEGPVLPEDDDTVADEEPVEETGDQGDTKEDTTPQPVQPQPSKPQPSKEDSEAVKEAKQKIYELESRNKTVFEKMVYNLTEACVKNADMREQFVIENGRVDMDRIVDSVRCMYTMLEMVSTLKIENVDAAYVESTLQSIK